MKTKIIRVLSDKSHGAGIAGREIRRGGLVAFPTETVYGLGANGLDGEAVKRIFEVKGRPNDNPLILHVARKTDARALWREVPEVAEKLMDAFWPGPLTLIYYKSDIVPPEVTAGLDTVAVRIPDSETATFIIRMAGVPIAAPSANLSGKPSPTLAKHVIDDFMGKINVIVDGGPCRVGVESTVVSLTGDKPMILRPGGITKEMLESVVGEVEVSPAVLRPLLDGEKAESPGMKHRHYAPNCEVLVVKADIEETKKITKREYMSAVFAHKNTVILATKQTEDCYKDIFKYTTIGDREHPDTLCRNLFSALRMYSDSVDLIIAEAVEPKGEGLAYMNRLLRAAGFKIIDK